MQILTFSSLYPNNVDPSHGIFVERRLRELTSRTDIRSTVISPVPWFPFQAKIFGDYAAMAAIPKSDRRYGIDILYPRFPLIPRIGMNTAAKFMSMACKRSVRGCLRERGVQLIDAHYFYPDGVAASLLARELDLPYCITARGSDINLIAKYAAPRRQMLQAAHGASALVTVSEALAEAMQGMGMPSEKIHVLRNGVDLDFFSPGRGRQQGSHASSSCPTFLSIGALKKAKGHDIAIRFVSQLAEARLVIIGRGPEEATLRHLADQLGVGRRVVFTGTLDPEALRQWYRDADAVILMSEREGMPNVILESLACGTPVLATSVGGVPEILTDSSCGQMVSDRNADALSDAWQDLSLRGIDSEKIQRFASRLSWKDTIDKLHDLMKSVSSQR